MSVIVIGSNGQLGSSLKYIESCEDLSFRIEYLSKKDLNIKIPSHINYKEIGGLSKECYLALEKARPTNLASASRIPGITPAALTSVLLHTKKVRTKKIA